MLNVTIMIKAEEKNKKIKKTIWTQTQNNEKKCWKWGCNFNQKNSITSKRKT